MHQTPRCPVHTPTSNAAQPTHLALISPTSHAAQPTHLALISPTSHAAQPTHLALISPTSHAAQPTLLAAHASSHSSQLTSYTPPISFAAKPPGPTNCAQVVTDTSRIAYNYLRGSFVIDLLGSFPINLVVTAATGDAPRTAA